MPLFWLIVAMVAIGIEAIATHFVLLFVALAALLTAGLAAWPVPVLSQVIVFSLTSVCLPIILRRPLLRRFTGRGLPSRGEGCIGLPAIVTETIDPELATGRVMTNGQDWKAKSHTRIEAGCMSRVVGSDGIVLVVEPQVKVAQQTPSA